MQATVNKDFPEFTICARKDVIRVHLRAGVSFDLVPNETPTGLFLTKSKALHIHDHLWRKLVSRAIAIHRSYFVQT
jgi:hypothetical protein